MQAGSSVMIMVMKAEHVETFDENIATLPYLTSRGLSCLDVEIPNEGRVDAGSGSVVLEDVASMGNFPEKSERRECGCDDLHDRSLLPSGNEFYDGSNRRNYFVAGFPRTKQFRERYVEPLE